MPHRRNIVPREGLATIALLAALVAGGCSKPAPQAAFEMPPTPVETAVVEARPVADTLRAVGTVEAAEWVSIASEIDGRAIRLPIREGDRVRRGEVLVQLDGDQLAADVKRAQAVLDRAKVTHARVERLRSEEVVPESASDTSGADLKVAEADLAVARARLAKAVIRAPFDGVVGARRVSPGAFVRAGEAITELTQSDEIKVTFSAPERTLSQLALGSAVRISTTAWPDQPLRGRVTLVEPVVDFGTRSARIVARAPNPDGRLRPGMSAEVEVVLDERPGAATVPSEAVFVEGDKPYVYVVKDDGTVSRTAITLGTRMADAVEVTAGLQPGTRVVRAGHQKLYEGAKVAPVEAPPAS
jgi:membrane fusion protein (multidrug efflux system)